MFHNILVALDSTPTAARALTEARDLAQALHARLTIISVTPEVPGFAYRAGVDVEALEQEAETETERLLRKAVESMPSDLPVTSVLRHGHVGEEIVKRIQEGNHDLLVMGSRGLGRVAASVFGSVGAYVHYHSRVAMLVIHPKE